MKRKIDGVKNIRTVYKATGSNNVIYYNGLKFAKWTPNILNGADRELVTGNYKLEEFMYPRLTESSMNNRIKIITQSAYGVNEVEY
jgi:ABC-type Zn uptake system ZnuABC Zn-binding protein ZnuA